MTYLIVPLSKVLAIFPASGRDCFLPVPLDGRMIRLTLVRSTLDLCLPANLLLLPPTS